MIYLRYMIGLLLLLVSFSGYAITLYYRFDVKAEFISIVISSTIGIVMFSAGLVNMLPEMTLFILISGILLALCGVKSNRKLIKYFPFCIFIFFIIFGIVILLEKTFFTGWDNFSHWALVVKKMLEKDSFPNFMDSVITFQSYPTGSSVFIYFVCKIVGNSEGIMYFAQNILLISSLICFWAYIERKNWLKNIFGFMLSIFLFTYNEYVNGLMVDNLLPSLGLAGVMILFYYRNDIRKGILLVLPICCLLVEIKNSGIFFVALIWVIAMLLPKSRRDKYYFFSLLVLPILYLFLWKKHVNMVFENGLSSLHSMSINNFSSVLEGKTIQNVYDIVKLYLSKVFSITQNGIWIFLLLFLLLFLYYRLRKDYYAQKLVCKFLVVSLGIYALWHISLIATYLCSMPLDEALRLASYERYHETILVYLVGCGGFLVLLLFADNGDKGDVRLKKYFFVLTGIGMALVSFHSILAADRYYESSALRRKKLSQIIAANDLLPGASYAIYTKEADNGYLYFVGRYEFDTTAVVLVNEETVREITDWDAYTYLILLDKNNELRDEVAKGSKSVVILER